MAGLVDGLDKDLSVQVLGLEEGCSHVSAAHDPLILDSNGELESCILRLVFLKVGELVLTGLTSWFPCRTYWP